MSIYNLSGMTRDEVVPYYMTMIASGADEVEVKRINRLIIDRWSTAALIYIKERAWKKLERNGRKAL